MEPLVQDSLELSVRTGAVAEPWRRVESAVDGMKQRAVSTLNQESNREPERGWVEGVLGQDGWGDAVQNVTVRCEPLSAPYGRRRRA
jgi:hypothetical protein